MPGNQQQPHAKTSNLSDSGNTPLPDLSARKGSTPTYESTSDSTSHKENDQGTRRESTSNVVASPAYTTFSPTTSISANMTTPDPSVMAIHGSVMTNFPMPRGFKHDNMSEDEWDKIASNLNKGTISKGVSGTFTIPETPIEEKLESNPSKLDKEVEDNTSRRNQEKKAPKTEAIVNKNKKERIIAIDFDDVCCETMATIIKQHNVEYNTDLTIYDLKTCDFWQNRGWGTPAEVARKEQTLNDLLPLTTPIEGFAEGLRELHEMGHPIHIVTSRPAKDREGLIQWLGRQGVTIGHDPQDLIVEVHFKGAYNDIEALVEERGLDDTVVKELNDHLRSLWAESIGKRIGGLSKLKIIREINASLFIDDHYGDLEPIIKVSPNISCLLFGEYGWNRYNSGSNTPIEMFDYNERSERGLILPNDHIKFGKEHNLYRVKDWKELVEWVKEWDNESV
ncbi:uncharacterized protein I206_104211 [Kwoniella pini CBS 10737]|uniref:Uncharacterized protein n=1 Tax=Kwoniella pini CBS 10737 TaxID=1296096 RepID=A0A1B9I2B0_9TREE|nr:uncharacterized protein I206_04214 [Kwoniella pini CBS 10737]OCF49690.1 hypothetical protein I206_04214 [Kwoniella pini CBS 10737]